MSEVGVSAAGPGETLPAGITVEALSDDLGEALPPLSDLGDRDLSLGRGAGAAAANPQSPLTTSSLSIISKTNNRFILCLLATITVQMYA